MSLLRNNGNPISETIDLQEDAGMHDFRDVMRKLNVIYQYITSRRDEVGMPQKNLMEDLVASVAYSNEKIRKLTFNLDEVISNLFFIPLTHCLS